MPLQVKELNWERGMKEFIIAVIYFCLIVDHLCKKHIFFKRLSISQSVIRLNLIVM